MFYNLFYAQIAANAFEFQSGVVLSNLLAKGFRIWVRFGTRERLFLELSDWDPKLRGVDFYAFDGTLVQSTIEAELCLKMLTEDNVDERSEYMRKFGYYSLGGIAFFDADEILRAIPIIKMWQGE